MTPSPPRIQFFRLRNGGSENALLGSSEVPFVPFRSAISHGVLVPPVAGLAVGSFGLGLADGSKHLDRTDDGRPHGPAGRRQSGLIFNHPKRLSLTAVPLRSGTAEHAEKDLSAPLRLPVRCTQTGSGAQAGQIVPVRLWRTGTRVLRSRHAFFRACATEGLVGSGSAVSACLCRYARRQATSAVKNLGLGGRKGTALRRTPAMRTMRHAARKPRYLTAKVAKSAKMARI